MKNPLKILNCRLIISEYYDSLINDIDIYTEDALIKLTAEPVSHVLSEEYWNMKRRCAIEVIEKIKQANLEFLKLNSSRIEPVMNRFKRDFDIDPDDYENRLNDLQRDFLFVNKFCFIINIRNTKFRNNLTYRIFLIVVEFYLNSVEVANLE